MESLHAPQRRLHAIHSHLLPPSTDHPPHSHLHANLTAGEFAHGHGYSVVLPEKLHTGKWDVHRSARSPFNLVSRFADHPQIGTLHDNFVRSVEVFRDYKFLGTRNRVDGTVGEYKWMTYGEAATAREAIGSGLRFHGLEKGACVGLYFINRPEWLIVDYACSAYSFISVPLYDTLGPDAVKYAVNHAGVQAVFCAPQTLSTMLTFVSEIPSVQLIVVVGGMDEHLPSLPSTSRVKLISYLKLISQGRSNLQPFCPPKPEDVATICYTSGTTGTPKGVVLTHGNFIANAAGFCHAVTFYPSDIIANSVKTSGTLRERLFQTAYSSKKQSIMSGSNGSPIWDRLVFNKIKEKLGGRVRFMGSGASPLSPDVMDFLRVCFGCQVIEGYGMTETSCAMSMMDEGDNLSGHVGSPNPACEIKLVDVPEMNYTSEDQPHPRGEICVRGPIVFQGYHKDEIQTKEVIDDDGWLHTGDIGLWLPGGQLKIIDRKKNIFKLAQGEYIAPEKVENVYAKCEFVAQSFVYGDSFNSCLVVIVVVDPDVLKAWAASAGIKYEDLSQLCSDPRARTAVLASMDALGKEAQLRGFEFAKAVTLVLEPFTLENGLLTPTFKIKRPQAKEHFAKAISTMYSELSDAVPAKL
ncbi:hypothetical protein PRUPE_6G325200 [Prunus persica]|uniref:AMP-dependent synthetase/ligase domain-containing protein n=1 Tax=Prunus persica TaxID=3760 RepID=A0A251P0E5_PRUPE|nr:long chain acyl-CoA synthetase 6, peroxisomal isoform X3 [Prunus persica]ONI04510.1 hypothetical protein PRUPE_6G325200 [Prunus persica]